jgi:hypothetical protein
MTNRDADEAARHIAAVTVTCPVCRADFQPARRRQRECSPRCNNSARTAKPADPAKTCGHCGGSMTGKRPQARWCGDRCRDRARRVRERTRGTGSSSQETH